MAASEPARLALYNRLGEVLGSEHAETLMSSLPLQSTSDLVTKSDIERLERRIDRLAEEIHAAQRTYMVATVGAMTALTAIFGVIVGIVV